MVPASVVVKHQFDGTLSSGGSSAGGQGRRPQARSTFAWDEESFFAALSERGDDSVVAAVREIFAWANEQRTTKVPEFKWTTTSIEIGDWTCFKEVIVPVQDEPC